MCVFFSPEYWRVFLVLKILWEINTHKEEKKKEMRTL